MTDEIRWIIGISITALAALIGAFWKILSMIHREEDARENADKEVHSRINRVREDMVHKSDLESRLNAVDSNIREIRSDTKDILKHLAKPQD